MKTSHRSIVSVLKKRLKEEFLGEGSGHDWWHIERVYNLSLRLAALEKRTVDRFVIELAALLHDLEDWKFQSKLDAENLPRTRKILKELNVGEETTEKVISIIVAISYKRGKNTNTMTSFEGMIVQDADRLDALGAIGIARTFAYGGMRGREIYNPRKKTNTSIVHFYEKLLLLKDKLNTRSAKKLAKERHAFLQSFLKQFYKEVSP